MESGWLGVDVGGTKILACVVDESGGRRLREVLDTIGSGPDVLVESIRTWRRRAADQGIELRGVGLGLPGLVDARGVMRSSVILPSWIDADLRARVEDHEGIPCTSDNDVNQAARAESALRGSEARDFLFVSIGTGIGGAVVIDGRVHRGARGYAGEIGHVSVDLRGSLCACGRRGCAGATASGGGIERIVSLQPGTLAAALKLGHQGASRALERSFRTLGAAIANAVHLLDPGLVVLGGGLTERGASYVNAIARSLGRELSRESGAEVRVEAARSGYDASAIGAALSARQEGGCPRT